MESFNYEDILKQKTKKGYFDPMKITKYFNDQKPCDPYEDVYIDKQFPPDRNSILSIPKFGSCKNKENQAKLKPLIESIEFKRADDIFGKDWAIFQGKIEIDDVKQGRLGNCYLLSAIASLVSYNPSLIYQLFRVRSKNQEFFQYKNYFEVVLFIDGAWQVVIIDDYFISYKESEKYLHDSEFPFTRPNKKELWVLILEKAWAKINGGYSNTITGSPEAVFKALTGRDSESIFFKCPSDFKKYEEVWEMVNGSFTKGYALCAAPGTTKYQVEAKEFGLLFEHVYSMISAKEGEFDGEKLRLVNFRNPWGNGEWTGRYSDNDTANWTPAKKAYFNFEEAKDDGSFFMHFEDFYKYWGYLFICQLKAEARVKSFSIPPMEKPLGSVFLFYFEETTTMYIDLRIHNNAKDVRGNIVYASYNDKKEFFGVDGFYIIASQETNTVKFQKGYHIIWIYQHVPNIEMKVIFTIDKDFRVDDVRLDQDFSLIREIVGQGYIQNNQVDIKRPVYNSYGKQNTTYHSNHYQNLWGTGFGYLIFMGMPGSSEEKNLRIKLKCEKEYLWQILPPHNESLDCEFVYNTKKNKKPFVILGQKHQNADWLYFFESINDTTDEPTVFDSYDYEKYLTFDFKLSDSPKNIYDYIL